MLSRNPVPAIAFAIGLALIAFQSWLLFEAQQPLLERPVHLCAALVLLFLYKPLRSETLPRWLCGAIDALLAAHGTSADPRPAAHCLWREYQRGRAATLREAALATRG